jgi:hypothetical protein
MPKLSSKVLSAAILATAMALPATAETARGLPEVLRAASREGRFNPPPVVELERVEKLFLALARGEAAAALEKDAAALDLELVRSVSPDAWVVREKDSARRGRGLFAFRDSPQKHQDVLQVPHSFKDEMTREIGLALFAEGRFAAAAWNTVPRHYNDNGQRIDADMAHLEHTYFMAFTRALAQTHASGTVLQIHGFDQGKRKSTAAADADLILSAGHENPPEHLRRKWRCLAGQFGAKVALFPETARELGGTTNAQVALLKTMGLNNFIHAEMSRSLRETLRDNSQARAQVLGCLQGHR